MQKYTNELMPALDMLLQSPESAFERWLSLVLAVIAGMLVLSFVSRAFRVEKSSALICLAVSAISWVFALAALIVARVHLPGVHGALLWAMPVGAALVFGLLAMFLLMRAGLGKSLVPWLVSAAAMVGVILLTHTVFQSAATGDRQADSIRTHKRQLRDVTGE